LKYKNLFRRAAVLFIMATLLLTSGVLQHAAAQSSLSGVDRDRAQGMLDIVQETIKKNYYDQNFHGLDIDARFKLAHERLKTASSLGQAYGIIAQAVLDLNDSHTLFYPPERAASIEYGWQMQIFGDKAYISAVKPGSDAEAQGIKPGDMVISLDGFKPSRENVWRMQYGYYTIRPQAAVRLVLQNPKGEERQLEVKAKVTQLKRRLNFSFEDGLDDYFNYLREREDEARLRRHRYYENMSDVFIWQMPQFDLNDSEVDEMMGKARKRKAMILDLRGNGGGYIDTLKRLVGNFFEKDIKIGDSKGRKETKPMIAKSRGADNIFKGKLIVLIDSRSASCSELFARTVQLEKRGMVLGDKSHGAVMMARGESFKMGVETAIYYTVLVTHADIVMTDGKSLERVGVTPDETMLPTPDDMAAKRDPVLAHAAELAGLTLDPEKAGALFPLEWKK